MKRSIVILVILISWIVCNCANMSAYLDSNPLDHGFRLSNIESELKQIVMYLDEIYYSVESSNKELISLAEKHNVFQNDIQNRIWTLEVREGLTDPSEMPTYIIDYDIRNLRKLKRSMIW